MSWHSVYFEMWGLGLRKRGLGGGKGTGDRGQGWMDGWIGDRGGVTDYWLGVAKRKNKGDLQEKLDTRMMMMMMMMMNPPTTLVRDGALQGPVSTRIYIEIC